MRSCGDFITQVGLWLHATALSWVGTTGSSPDDQEVLARRRPRRDGAQQLIAVPRSTPRPKRHRRPRHRLTASVVAPAGWRLLMETQFRGSGSTPWPTVLIPAFAASAWLPRLLGARAHSARRPPHPAPYPNRTMNRAHRGPPDWVDLLQQVGGSCRARIILSSNTIGKSHWTALGRPHLRGHSGRWRATRAIGPVCGNLDARPCHWRPIRSSDCSDQ